MVPDSDSSRLARLEQRVNDHDTMIRTVAPLSTQQAVLNAEVAHIRDDLREVGSDVDGLVKEMRDRFHRLADDQQKRDESRVAEDQRRDEAEAAGRRQLRVALYGLIGVLGAALIAALATILVALAG